MSCTGKSREKWLAGAAVLICGLVTHGYILTNKISYHDDTDVILEQYGILKVNEEQYRTLDKTAVIKVQKETYGYACFTNDRRFYQENYPQIVVEQGGIDELILMMTGGYR